MSIDPYSPCPGGTGKKVKFCCPDLLGEMEKIYRMLDGEQRAACLEYIEKLESKYPDRACLLSIKSTLQMQLGQKEQAAATLSQYQQKYPDNPVALAEAAITKIDEGDTPAAVISLQHALEASDRELPPQVYSTMGMLSQGLLLTGYVHAARHHLMMQMSIKLDREDERPLAMLMRIDGSPEFPLLLKQDFNLILAPSDALWKKDFDENIQLAHRGLWLKAEQGLTALAAKTGDWPLICQTLAELRSRLADVEGATKALRKLAEQSVPLDDAVEAEALAQVYDPETTSDKLDVLGVEYGVSDIDLLISKLMVHRQADRIPDEMLRRDDDQPPAKASFWLLDKALPETGVGASRASVPHTLGRVSIYGKQTDREARVELGAYRNEQLAAAQKVLTEIAGDTLGTVREEKVLGQTTVVVPVLNMNLRFPDDTPVEDRRKVLTEERRDRLINVWPDLPQGLFGGKTAREAAGDPKYKVRVLGAILMLELTDDASHLVIDFNELRSTLGLPTLGMVEIEPNTARELPLVRLSRLDVKKLSDDDLMDAFHRATHYRYDTAILKLATEVVGRPSLDEKMDRSEAYSVLMQVEPDVQKRLEYLNEGRKLSLLAKHSCVSWDLEEFTLRLALGQATEAQNTLNHIRNYHLQEPGVAQALMQVLVEAGIIRPDGTPVAAAPGAGAAGLVVPGAAAQAEPGKIWTPGSDLPGGGAGGGGKKSAIWTPGD